MRPTPSIEQTRHVMPAKAYDISERVSAQRHA